MNYKELFNQKEQQIIKIFLTNMRPSNLDLLENLNETQIQDCKNILKTVKQIKDIK